MLTPPAQHGVLHHVDAGAGEPALVLVHGFTCALGDWDAQRARFAGERRVVAVDLPGHGASPAGEGLPGIAAFGRALADLLESLAIGRAVLVGHSLGCRVVLEAARHLHGRVAGIALVDGSRLGSGDPETARRSVTDRVAAIGWGSFARGFFDDMFTSASDASVRERIVARAARMPAALAAELIADGAGWDAGELDAALAAARVPVLVVQSTRIDERRERATLSQGESTAWIERVVANCPGARVEIVPGVGYFTMIEAADAVNRALAGFLRGLGAVPAPAT